MLSTVLNQWMQIKRTALYASVIFISMIAGVSAVTFSAPDGSSVNCTGDVSIEKGGVVRCLDAGTTTLLQSCAGSLVFDTQGVIRCATVAIAPVCTLLASPASIASGGSSILTATCNPVATSYLWTGVPASFGGGSSGSVFPTVTSSYTVRGVNTTETGQSAAVTVTVSSGGTTPTAPPVCSLTQQAGFVQNSTLLIASCNPAATTYVWSTNANCTDTASSSCTVLPTTTTAYSMTGSNSKGTGNTATITVIKSTACTVTASPASVGIGESAILTASCNPVATSYAWTSSPDLLANGVTATVTPTTDGIHNYSVIGSSGSGDSPLASTTVTVTAPVCTVTATPATIDVGGSSTLTASCTPAAASYAWTQSTTLVAGSGNTATATPTTAGVHAYSVIGTNGSGASALASANVTVAVPSCTLSANPNPVTAGTPTTLSANCSPAATSFAWSDASCSSASSSCSLTYATPGSYAVTVRGSNAAGAGAQVQTSVTVNAPSVTPTGCTVQSITWPQGLNLQQGGTPQKTIYKDQMYAFSITMPSRTSTFSGLYYGTSQPGDLSISTNACEWGTPDLTAKQCTRLDSDPIVYNKTSDQPGSAPCVLEAGQTYYFNVRYPGCPEGTACRFYLAW